MFLDQIVAHKKQEIESRKMFLAFSEVKRKAQARTPPRDFFQAFKQECGNATRIIAEIKKASPSRGIIRKDFDPRKIGTAYQKEGAMAISVLTDSKFFQGDFSYLSLVKKCTNIPLLCKDFIFDSYQIYEAQIEEFLSLGKELGMRALVEVHSEDDLEKVLQTSAKIIGINNRDLKTFKTDIRTTFTLVKLIPAGKLVVSESGIYNRAQIEQLEDAGVHAFLIGEALMREKDPGEKLRELRGKT
ncbi:MAG: indole-3-glycerol-phosphate synthase [Deltaproteobacteria bacterium]|nr:indole-3-glycerol-phosphate synthase [Deltaproteobacteria bacterium]